MTYIEPVARFAAVSILDGDCHTHYASSYGGSTIVCIARSDFKTLLAQDVGLCNALLRLHAAGFAASTAWWMI